MKNLIKIPVAIQVRVDDVGWHRGADGRAFSGPARTGMPRDPVVEDYKVLNELGKAIDMKICCSIPLAEWDKENVLRGVPHITPYPDKWDRASEINMSYAEACMEALESGGFLDYTCHGLYHAHFDEGKHISGREFYPPVYDEANQCYSSEEAQLPIEEFERHIELYFKIYNAWGFQKKIESFTSPAGCIGTPQDNEAYCSVLRKYGIYYWNNSWHQFKDTVDAASGVICASGLMLLHWAAYDVDPDLLPDAVNQNGEPEKTDFGFHWPNFLRFHPEHNMERLPKWVDYFNRQSEIFGLMLAKDVGFANSQALYNRFADIRFEEGKCIIDFAEVDNKGAVGLKNEFYISFQNGVTPKGCVNGKLELYQTKKAFQTYKVTRNDTKPIAIEL